MSWELLSTFVQVFCTLAIFSFLYEDNPIYKFAEHLFVGVATGWWITLEFRDVILPNMWEPLMAGWTGSDDAPARWGYLHIPFLLGLLVFMRLSPKASYLARWSMAAIVGTYAGLAVRGFAAGDLFGQVKATVVPFVGEGHGAALAEEFTLDNLLTLLSHPVLIVGTVSVLIYFFFSVPHKGAVGGVATVGIWFLMVSFGASYGNTVMARISLFIGRTQFLLTEKTKVGEATWEHKWITVVLAAAIIAFLVVWNKRTANRTAAPGEDAA